MTGQGQVFLDFGKLVVVDDGNGVLLPVDGLLLQGGIHSLQAMGVGLARKPGRRQDAPYFPWFGS